LSGRSFDLAIEREEDAMRESKQSSSRLRRWLDKRRDRQRHAAKMGDRAKAARKQDEDRAARHGSVRSGDPGSFGGM
jgi:hypothetical protein